MSRPKHPGKLTGSGRIKWNTMTGPGSPGNPRSTTPMSTSKSVKAETIIGGWGSGLGNNVSNTMRGVNSEPDRMAAELDKTAGERAAKYAANRKTDAYKMARAQAKRERRKHAGGIDGHGKSFYCKPRPVAVDATEDRSVKRNIPQSTIIALGFASSTPSRPRTYTPSLEDQRIERLRSMR